MLVSNTWFVNSQTNIRFQKLHAEKGFVVVVEDC